MRQRRYVPHHHTPEDIAHRRQTLAKARSLRHTGTTSRSGDTLPVGWLSPLLRSGWDVTLHVCTSSREYISTTLASNTHWYLRDIDHYSGLDSFPQDVLTTYLDKKSMYKAPNKYELAPSEIHKVARVNKEPGALLENLHYAAQELVTLYQTTLDEKVKVQALKHFMDCQMEQIRAARDMQLIVQGISEERWGKIKARLTELVEEHPELEKDIRKALEG